MVFSIQPIDETGTIGFEDGRDVIEVRSFARFEEEVKGLVAEGFDCLDVTVTASRGDVVLPCPYFACNGEVHVDEDTCEGPCTGCGRTVTFDVEQVEEGQL